MTGAIIVLYHPDLQLIDRALERLLPQVEECCLVDNGDTSLADHFKGRERVTYIPLMRNTGIAAAQNRGIRHFRERGFDHVLFSDQDSLGSSFIVEELLKAEAALSRQGHQVAAIGPLPINPKSDRTYYNKPRNIRERLVVDDGEMQWRLYRVHSIISSYSLVSIETLNQVGPMEEALFIDAVDNEWCWRAESRHGLSSFILFDLRFEHQMGRESRLPFKKSTPMRLYYQYRNFLILSRRRYVPLFWKWHCAWTYLLKLGFYPLFVSPRRENLRSILRGIRDGLALRTSLSERN